MLSVRFLYIKLVWRDGTPTPARRPIMLDKNLTPRLELSCIVQFIVIKLLRLAKCTLDFWAISSVCFPKRHRISGLKDLKPKTEYSLPKGQYLKYNEGQKGQKVSRQGKLTWFAL